MLGRFPRLLLHCEGLVVAAAAIAIYFYSDYRWWLLLLLALAPDVALAGRALGPRIGAATYNVAHTYVLPVALGAAGVIVEAGLAVEVGLIWVAHIGVDRVLGFGLKYPTSFKETHLQRV